MLVTVNDVPFEVIDEGRGFVILLLHGFPDSAKLWKYQVRLNPHLPCSCANYVIRWPLSTLAPTGVSKPLL